SVAPSAARSGARRAPATAAASDRPDRARPRGRTRSRPGRGAPDGRARRSQAPARMQRHDAAGERLRGYAAEAGGANHRGEIVRLGKAPDRLDEVAVGFRIARDRAAERRDDIERIEVIERVEPRHVDGGELETEEMAAQPEHAEGFLQRRLDAR